MQVFDGGNEPYIDRIFKMDSSQTTVDFEKLKHIINHKGYLNL